MSETRVRDSYCGVSIGKRIRHFIEAEIYDYGWFDWLSERVIDVSEMERFLDAGEAALDERSNDMADMVYAVVRRPYGNYDDDDFETLLRMFATWKEADEYIRDRVMAFRPVMTGNDEDCWVYEYGMPDTDTTVATIKFPQFVIRPFYVEGEQCVSM